MYPIWKAGESADGEFLIWDAEIPDEAIAAVMPGPHRDKIMAMLLAAPQMLEALRMAFDCDLTYLSDHAEIPRQDVVRARLAIKAALGATPNAELCGGPSGPSERAPGYADFYRRRK